MRGVLNLSVQWLNKFENMLCSAFLNSLLTVASVQYFSFNTKLQLVMLVNSRIMKKNSVYIQKDSGNFHIHLSSQFRKEMKLKHSLCTASHSPVQSY